MSWIIGTCYNSIWYLIVFDWYCNRLIVVVAENSLGVVTMTIICWVIIFVW